MYIAWLNLQWASRKPYERTLPNVAAWTTGKCYLKCLRLWVMKACWPQIFLIQALSAVLPAVLPLQTGLGSCFLDASFCRSSISCSLNKIISSCCNLRDGLIFGWTVCLGPWVDAIYDTVDGRNPAPPVIYGTLWKMGNSPYQLVQDSLHQQLLCMAAWLQVPKALRGTGGTETFIKSQAFWINISSHKWDSMNNIRSERHCSAWCQNTQQLHAMAGSNPFQKPEFFPQIFNLQIFLCKPFLHQHGKGTNCTIHLNLPNLTLMIRSLWQRIGNQEQYLLCSNPHCQTDYPIPCHLCLPPWSCVSFSLVAMRLLVFSVSWSISRISWRKGKPNFWTSKSQNTLCPRVTNGRYMVDIWSIHCCLLVAHLLILQSFFHFHLYAHNLFLLHP